MARQLQTLITDLVLTEDAFEVYDDQAVATPVRTPDDDAVAWEHRPATLVSWDGWQADGDRFVSRARLAGAGSYVLDDDAAGDRTITTPTISPSRARAWQALELWHHEPTSTSCRYRLVANGAALWWDGAAWTVPDAGEWNTRAEVQANFDELPGTVRSLAVRARLGTTSASATPTFYGARAAYGVSYVDDYDDALVRTLLASLRQEVRATGVLELDLQAETTDVVLTADAGADTVYDVTSVDAVYDLTADDDEQAPLAGTFAGGTWTADDPVPAGRRLRVEFRYRPLCVVRRHQDFEQLARLPEVHVIAEGEPEVLEGQHEQLVRNLEASPPTALAMPGSSLITQRLRVAVITELGTDAGRIARSLRAWLGRSGYRVAVSTETARLITVQRTGALREVTGRLSQGVVEMRGEWTLTYPQVAGQAPTTVNLVRAGGVTAQPGS